MTNEELLAEIEDIIRNIPSRATIRDDLVENYSWLGRTAAALEEWDKIKGPFAKIYIDNIQSHKTYDSNQAWRKILTLLHQARHDLRMKTIGPLSIAISNGMVFNYFDEIRKIVETANQEIFFVDPYLDAEFVSRYLSNVKRGVFIRLLAREKLNTLLPAINEYRTQSNQKIEVRSASGFHDRYVFIDRISCYQSGASFKDGAKKSPTTITQITDAFQAVFSMYEQIWVSANIESS